MKLAYVLYLKKFLNMWLFILVISFGLQLSLECRSYADIPDDAGQSFFSNSSTWGGGNPMLGNDSWKFWVAMWGTPNNSRFDSTEEGRDAESGWPTYWKGLGEANKGVPPPPWAYVPSSYGKPQFCFLQPRKGNCNKKMIRWGYNPTVNECQTFIYSGCGANHNNFRNKKDCQEACVNVPATGCDAQEKINFEELIFE